MNKQEAQKVIDKVQKKFDKLQKKLEEVARDQIAWAERMLAEAEPDTSELVFKPEQGEDYEFIGTNGNIFCRVWRNNLLDFEKLKVGNVFRVGTAKNSAKYYFMNSEYDYWIPWSEQPKPKVLPKGLEYWSSGMWQISGFKEVAQLDIWFIYRWKRSEQ